VDGVDGSGGEEWAQKPKGEELDPFSDISALRFIHDARGKEPALNEQSEGRLTF